MQQLPTCTAAGRKGQVHTHVCDGGAGEGRDYTILCLEVTHTHTHTPSLCLYIYRPSLAGQIRNSSCLWWENLGEPKVKNPHSNTLAWKILWTEEPGGLQSMGSLRVRHDWATSLSLFTFMPWRRKWQPTPVFLPGGSQGQGRPGGLPSMGSHRVGHDWSDLAVAVKVKN